MAEYYPQWLAGQDITADQLNAMLPKTAFKYADTSRSNTATPTDDPELSVVLDANATYIWHGWLKYSASTAGDLKIDFSGPSGVLGEWSAIAAGTTPIGVTATPGSLQANTQASTGYLMRVETNDVEQARSYGGLGSSVTLCVFLKGSVRTSSGGTYSLQWSQDSSDATATTVYTDSWIEFRRIK